MDPITNTYNAVANDINPYLAKLSRPGYSSFLHGNVVDMLYFPVLKGHFPQWFPFWGGQDFEFFRPIFNLADASISTGVISILVFQKRFFKQRNAKETHHTVETEALVNDESQVS
jgi:signal peptidase II